MKNNYTAYELIIDSAKLSSQFVKATTLIKSKAITAKTAAMLLLHSFEAGQCSNPDFVIGLYELLTDARQRRHLLKGIATCPFAGST